MVRILLHCLLSITQLIYDNDSINLEDQLNTKAREWTDYMNERVCYTIESIAVIILIFTVPHGSHIERCFT